MKKSSSLTIIVLVAVVLCGAAFQCGGDERGGASNASPRTAIVGTWELQTGSEYQNRHVFEPNGQIRVTVDSVDSTSSYEFVDDRTIKMRMRTPLEGPEYSYNVEFKGDLMILKQVDNNSLQAAYKRVGN